MSALPEGNQKIVAILTPRLAKAKEKVDAAAAVAAATEWAEEPAQADTRTHTHTSINTYIYVCMCVLKALHNFKAEGSAIAVKCSIKEFPVR